MTDVAQQPPPCTPGMRGVLVLGMGRSGTSSVTRMFQLSGYYVGSSADMMTANEANPTGYFENMKVWRTNEQVLADIGGTWFDVPDKELLASGAGAPLQRLLQELLDLAATRPLALKDPRVGILMPLWWPLLTGVLHPVLALRDPLEIALSLERRDMTALPVALAMWEVNLTKTLEHLDGELVTIVRYRDVVEDPTAPQRIVEEASTQLSPELAAMVRPERAADALEPSLYRNRAAALDGETWLTSHQDRLWAFLDSLPSGNARISVPSWAKKASSEARRLTHDESRRQKAHLDLGAQLVQAGQQIEARDAAISELNQVRAGLEQTRASLEQTLAQRSQQLDEALARIAACETDIAQERVRQQELAARLHDAEHWLSVLQTSISWRMTEPARLLTQGARRLLSGRGRTRAP